MKDKIKMMFNSHKIKYEQLSNRFLDIYKEHENKPKHTHIFIDFNLLMNKFMFVTNHYDKNKKSDEMIDTECKIFVSEFINLITHYKYYFYKHCCSKSNIYITLNKSRYGEKNRTVNDICGLLKTIIDMVPEVNVLTYTNDNELCFLKFHLINKISRLADRSNRFVSFLDIGKMKREKLLYMVTKHIYYIKFDFYYPKIVTFNDFIGDYISDNDKIYTNSIISFLPLIEALDIIKITTKAKINNVIIEYIKHHTNEDFNDTNIKLLVLKTFCSDRKVEKELKKIEYNIKSLKYKELIDNITRVWRTKIKDKNIYNINEILKMDEVHKISIEKLMSC